MLDVIQFVQKVLKAPKRACPVWDEIAGFVWFRRGNILREGATAAIAPAGPPSGVLENRHVANRGRVGSQK
jgi:hypothetical protein